MLSTLKNFVFSLSLAAVSASQSYALVNPNYHTYSRDNYLQTDEDFGAKGVQSTIVNNAKVIESSLNGKQVNSSSKTLTLVGSKIKAETADIAAETLKLVSDKDSQYRSEFSDTSGMMTRTIISQGFQKETTVASPS